jgi:poly-gamma-glutamate synthesis protein (capsule biosynthesis protein)
VREFLLLLLGIPSMLFGQKEVPEGQTVKIILGGDVMLGRSVMATSLGKNDPLYPFRQIGGVLASADFTLVNLENPIVAKCPTINTGMVFCTDPKMLEGLNFAGIDLVNLSNNHTLNYGKNGFEETKKYLEEAKIDYTGVGNLVIKKVNDIRFGFLGFDKSEQINPKLTTVESGLISNSAYKVDVLIVSMHWGTEYKDRASPGVQALARELVGLGVDVVVGHHPHWVQNIEYVGGKPVYYSLGNLVFDQMWSEKTKEGMLVELTFDGENIVNESLINTYIEKLGQPRVKE